MNSRDPSSDVFRKLPVKRRQPFGNAVIERRTLSVGRPKASLLHTSIRLAHMLIEVVRFVAKTILDKVLRQDSTLRRAKRLRLCLERMGGTLIKLGQQISLRADLLPNEYCQELELMLDDVPPAEFREVRKQIEAALGKTIGDVFEAFDKTPIGSGSVACVYQAILKGGDRTAVKVRRPGVVKDFAADLRALGWVLCFLEWLTVFRAGFSKSLRADLADMLFEELDFRYEARYQELFNKNARASGIRFVSAPRLYPSMCSEDVLVQEFVEGIWISDVMSAVEENDESRLSELADRGIIPENVSRNLMLAAYWSIHENMFFHADPHPANILVQDGGNLTLIDFGACGSTSQRSRRLQSLILHRFWRCDIEGAARAAISLVDPLPHIDTDELIKRASAVWWRKLFAMRSDYSPWWERTTATIWLSLLEVTREYQITINLDTLRSMRASLLYDTLAVRIWRDANDQIFEDYERDAQCRKARNFVHQMVDGFDVSLLASASDAFDLVQRLQSRAEEFADSYPMRLFQLPSKASYAISMAISCTIRLMLVTIALVLAVRILSPAGVGLLESVAALALNKYVVTAYLLYVFLYIRRVQYRLRDRDAVSR